MIFLKYLILQIFSIFTKLSLIIISTAQGKYKNRTWQTVYIASSSVDTARGKTRHPLRFILFNLQINLSDSDNAQYYK